MRHDDIFAVKEGWTFESFEFDKRVVNVFDDMVNRSVPGYSTIQLLTADIALQFYKDNYIYDLGCSTGNTIGSIIRRADRDIKIIGVDNSDEMVESCREKCTSLKSDFDHEIKIKNKDITDATIFDEGMADVVIFNLTLQFVRPIKRKEVLRNAFNNIRDGGCLLLVEKTIQKDKFINELFINYYHFYKKEMGYSDMEISAKREALENRLIPFYSEENQELLREIGFSKVSSFFQWMNFYGFVAFK